MGPAKRKRKHWNRRMQTHTKGAFGKNYKLKLFHYSFYFCYYSWVSLNFSILFMDHTILFQLTFTLFYSIFNNKFLVFNKISSIQIEQNSSFAHTSIYQEKKEKIKKKDKDSYVEIYQHEKYST